jgi:Holliday junction DNA helicase RuvA
MIAFLTGRLLDKRPNRIVVDVGGVGYDVAVPLSTFYTLGDPGAPVSLRIHTHVREDAMALFGFATSLELLLFERLIGVSGIGPKVALSVLSGIEPEELVRAVRTEDTARLTAIPGVGKKIAERIGLELKDRLPHALVGADDVPGQAGRSGGRLRDDLLSALVNLGYQHAAAEKAIARVVTRLEDGSFEDNLRAVLKTLTR